MNTVNINNFDFLYSELSKYKIQPFDIENLKKYFQKKQGWIYVSQNASFPEYKIGRTSKTPWERAKTLSTAGLLHDYEVLFALPVKNSIIMERRVHEILKKYRFNKTKELFHCKLEIAVKAVELAYHEEKDILSKTFRDKFFEEDLEFLEYSWLQDGFGYINLEDDF